jgi:hypothetical protein
MEKQHPWEGQILPANKDRDAKTPSSSSPNEASAPPDASATRRSPGGEGAAGRAHSSHPHPEEHAVVPGHGTPRGLSLWVFWALLTALGWAAAGFCIGAFVADDSSALQYAFVPLSALGQWLLLRRHFAHASMWLVATVGGAAVAALAYVVLLALPADMVGPQTSGLRLGLSTLIDGLAIAGAQWFVLRQNVSGTVRWIPAAAAPLWLLAFEELGRGADPATIGDVPTAVERLVTAGATLGIVGLFIGALTGAVLVWMIDQPRAWEE